MRPPRIAILVFFCAAFIFLVCRSLTAATPSPSPSQYPSSSSNRKSVWSFMYYNTPFSLFPANAAISLTDDNSTTFAARPAAFGPKLAINGLSGQLWVGSGFAEDSLEGNGELGCSDLPGWDGGSTARNALKNSLKTANSRVPPSSQPVEPPKRGDEFLESEDRDAIANTQPVSRTDADDGTDEYLNEDPAKPAALRESTVAPSHADIQSLQETAEIQGKVVLLMRGGCGFLEKVMWAQRRGAIAVIVGDNQKGGPLIQMFAHGDEVDNVTIPSVFTARTTAHLLSSLTQPGSYIEDSLDDNGNPVLKVQKSSRARPKPQVLNKQAAQQVRTSKGPAVLPKFKRSTKDPQSRSQQSDSQKPGWFSRHFSWGRSSIATQDKSRPPTSGRLDWVLVDDWSDERDDLIRNGMDKGKVKNKDKPPHPKAAGDNFVIGVQDWRDRALLEKSGANANAAHQDTKKGRKGSIVAQVDSYKKGSADTNKPKGGSITPGSGEYDPNQASYGDLNEGTRSGQGHDQANKGRGLMARIFGNGEDEDEDQKTAPLSSLARHPSDEKPRVPNLPVHPPHDGLWVTITPTSSASPFFDTLLVLVISPLVTLTVVYALLILRAKIRRRRWRAPKSVVERLPVRTYHTVATSRSPSPRLPSPSSASPTTPLLQQNPARTRPRSRTTTGVMESENFLSPSTAIPAGQGSSHRTSRADHVEKGAGGFSAEWRKYMGRQVECVVCLEEYVDGVSRVMSLPCGHEFHADCITPWLTTRRRTCPICKGDVVRSLARSQRSDHPRYEPYRDDSDGEQEAESSGQQLAGEDDLDVERGVAAPIPRRDQRSSRQSGWLNMLSNSFGSRAGGQSRSPSRSRARSQQRSPEDRSR